MNIDVVIATHNSEKRIARTLDSLCRMASSAAMSTGVCWRLLLVTNRCTDRTHNVIESYQNRLPIRLLNCELPGKSRALNSAIPEFKGDLIVFTDDDVEVAEDWLINIYESARCNPEYGIFAGRITGTWERDLDPILRSWIPIGSTYALHDDDMRSGPCDPGKVWGPNMAVRREVFEKGFRFDERIGPAPKKLYAMGQETEFAKRVAASGVSSYFNSEAVVRHLIKASTVNEDWIIRRAERLGYGIFAAGKSNYDRKLTNVLPLVIEILVFFAFFAIKFPFTFFVPPSEHRFWSRWKFYYYRGLLRGYLEFL